MAGANWGSQSTHPLVSKIYGSLSRDSLNIARWLCKRFHIAQKREKRVL